VARGRAGKVGYFALHPEHWQFALKQVANRSVEFTNTKDLSVTGIFNHAAIVEAYVGRYKQF
jgi:hypothetical protein